MGLLDLTEAALSQPDTQVVYYLAVLTSALLLLSWRFWRFTLVPHMRPSAPQELPYWIPGLGHALSFFKDFNKTIDDARVVLKDPNSIFTVNIAGQCMHICFSPEDIEGVYRNTTTITFHNVVRDMYQLSGISQEGTEKLFIVNPSAKHNEAAGRPLDPTAMIIEYHRRQTKPGEHLETIINKITPAISETLAGVQDGSSACIIPTLAPEKNHGHLVSIFSLASTLFLRSSATAFLGEKIWQVNPRFLESFSVWERTNWKFLFRMPRFLSQDMAQARDDLIKTFVDYLAVPAEERSDASYFVKSMESLMCDVRLDRKDQARVFMLHFWAILGNVYKVGFWTLTYLAYDQAALRDIYLEVRSAVKEGEVLESHIDHNCPLLESYLNETLRLTTHSALVRDVMRPTQLGGKILEEGSKVMVPYRQLHMNMSVWGQEPSLMVGDRFVKQPKLTSSKSYRPFGGGNTLCPGRFMAKRIIAYGVASTISKFDIKVDVEATRRVCGGKGDLPDLPRPDTSKPSPGVSLPVEGQDVFVTMTPRAEQL